MKYMEKQDRLIISLSVVIILIIIIFMLLYTYDKKREKNFKVNPRECVVEINYLMSDLELNKTRLIDLERICYGDVDLQRLHLLKIEAVKVIISNDLKNIDEIEQTLKQ